MGDQMKYPCNPAVSKGGSNQADSNYIFAF